MRSPGKPGTPREASSPSRLSDGRPVVPPDRNSPASRIGAFRNDRPPEERMMKHAILAFLAFAILAGAFFALAGIATEPEHRSLLNDLAWGYVLLLAVGALILLVVLAVRRIAGNRVPGPLRKGGGR